MKTSILAGFIILANAFSASATVTLQFSAPFSGGIASNFANANGVPTNAMIYGIVVDTSRNGVLPGDYTGFNLADGFLPVAGGVTDDYLALSSSNGTTTDTSSFMESPGPTTGSSGTINLVSGIPYGNVGSTNLDSGDPFSLIWFSSNSSAVGSKYGIYSNDAFIIPADGATVSFDSVFIGSDPIRSATTTIVPEPTSMCFVVIVGLLGVMRLRIWHQR